MAALDILCGICGWKRNKSFISLDVGPLLDFGWYQTQWQKEQKWRKYQQQIRASEEEVPKRYNGDSMVLLGND